MIFEFTKQLTALGSDYPIYDINNTLLFNIDFIKNGFNFNNTQNKLIAQTIKNKNDVTISIADSPSIFIDNNFNIKPNNLDENSLDKEIKTEEKRNLVYSYEIFGNPNIYSYDLFEKKNGEIKPKVVANIIDCPLNDKIFKVRIDDNCNFIRVLSIIFSINMLL